MCVCVCVCVCVCLCVCVCVCMCVCVLFFISSILFCHVNFLKDSLKILTNFP